MGLFSHSFRQVLIFKTLLMHSSCMRTCTFFWQYCNFFFGFLPPLYMQNYSETIWNNSWSGFFENVIFCLCSRGWVFSRSVISYMYLCSIIIWLFYIKDKKVLCVSETTLYDLYFEMLQSLLAHIVQKLWWSEGIFHISGGYLMKNSFLQI